MGIDLLTVDVETTIRNTVGSNKASAFCEDNFIVWLGSKHKHEGTVHIRKAPPKGLVPDPDAGMLVGHNLKFDLHHLRKMDNVWWEHALEVGVWDTSIAEYLLTAQIERFPTLDKCALKYGGTVKDERLKEEYWGKGIDTTEIPEDIIVPYLTQDVLNTELVAIAQMKQAEEWGMMPLCKVMMRAMLATAEMEWNGMYVDMDRLEKVQEDLEKERTLLLRDLEDMVVAACEDIPRDAINLSSNKQLAAYVFGGEIEYDFQQHIGEFKTGTNKGKPKYKKIKKYVNVNVAGKQPKDKWLNKNGYHSTSEEILQELNTDDHPFITGMLRLRWLNRQVSTYAEGLRKLVFPDGLIHHNLQCTSTVTGRLSSSGPNMQNIPAQGESEIKAYYASRWGKEGRIVSADYSQLEVVWLAWASGDEAMKADIRNGVDFHCKRLALKLNEPYDSVVRKAKVEELPDYVEMRKKIKTFSFQRSYGAGAKAIALATGMTEDEVREIIKNEEMAYPQLAQFYRKVQAEVERSAASAQKPYKEEDGFRFYYGFYVSPTGRRYHFTQSLFSNYDAEQGRRVTSPSFSPTIIKNYPIQGGATGDLVPLMMMVLLYKLRGNNKALLINQVHDSIMLDVHVDVLEEVCQLVKNTLEKAPDYLAKYFGLDFDLPLKVDVEYGLNWKEQEKFVTIEEEKIDMATGTVEAVTKEAREQKGLDNRKAWGVKIGDNWVNFDANITPPERGQVIEFTPPAKGEVVKEFTVSGSAPAKSAGSKAGFDPLGPKRGMYVNNVCELLKEKFLSGKVTDENIANAAQFVDAVVKHVDTLDIKA